VVAVLIIGPPLTRLLVFLTVHAVFTALCLTLLVQSVVHYFVAVRALELTASCFVAAYADGLTVPLEVPRMVLNGHTATVADDFHFVL
jgi:hypothetical protein